MSKISFTVPGIPVGKQRVHPHKGGRPFIPKETRTYEKAVLTAFRLAFPHSVPHTGPVLVRFTAVFPIPPSWPKSAREAAARGMMYHLDTPDKENIEKAILDALSPPTSRDGIPVDVTGFPWHNDKQCMGGGMKRYGEPARTDITFEFIDQPGGVMTPGQRKLAEKATKARSDRRVQTLGRTLNPRNANSKGSPTKLDLAIAAADERDASQRAAGSLIEGEEI